MNNNKKYIEEARVKYDSYDADIWIKAGFDEDSGGYCVYHKGHNFTKTGSGGDAEKIAGKILAQLGKQVEFLQECGTKQPDIKFDNQTWDIKYIDKANEQTIRNHIKDARKADNVLFYLTQEDKYILLDNAIKREVGRFLKRQIYRLPDIYIIDKKNHLKMLWKKQKGN